jgi:serine/threonine-protein kinase
LECLDASGLCEVFAGGPLRDDVVEAHLDGCAACRALVAAYARVTDESQDDVSPYGATTPSDPPPMLPASAARPAIGDVIAGRYRLEAIIGEGGMGIVWAARTLDGERRVALKMLRVDTPELTQRARREALVASLIGHPNIVEVKEVLRIEGEPPILVMDLLSGESLDRLLARAKKLAAPAAIRILLPLVAAVRAAHARGVLHRDLKPQNVFLARESEASEAAEDSEPVVLLLDFGLAKLVGQDVEALTRTGAIVGTPHYMAPEQLYGEGNIDSRADVWAIGALAYECLTGRRPLDGTSYAQLVRSAGRDALRPTSELAPDAPTALTDLIDRMLAHDREKRPDLGHVHAILDELARPA